MRYCMYCGMPMEDDDVFCTRCGRSTPHPMSAGEDFSGADREEGPEIRMRGMGYVHADPREDPSEPQIRSGAGKKRPDSSRWILIASAVILVAVFGLLLSLLIRPDEKNQKESGREVASYENGAGADTEKLQQGQAQPAVGHSTGQVQSDGSAQSDGSGEEGQASQDHAAAQTGKDAEAGDGQKTDPAADSRADAPSGEEGEETTELIAGSGRPDAAAQAQGTADADGGLTGQAGPDEPEAESGWMIDEDGNEVYYAPDGADNTDSDQTDVGGGEKAGRDSSYIIPGSDSRYLTRQELETFDDYGLQMAINELYARHGRKFDTESIRNFFESKSWYHGTIDPADFDGHEAQYFNQYELANRELMTQIREERGTSLTW